jgi:hypothetical protein
MRTTGIFIMAVLAAGLATGCTSTDRKLAAEPTSSEVAAARAIKETKEATRAMRVYAYAQRAEFVAQTKGELDGIEAELDRLSEKAVEASAQATLVPLREKWALAKKQLAQAESATESTWNDVQGSLRRSHDDLRDSVASARQWLSDKIEP